MYGRIAIGILVASAVASAQATKPTIAEQLRGGTANQQLRSDLGVKGAAGPGYIQQDFFKALRDALKREFGEKRGEEMYQHLLGQTPSSQDILDLMNGRRLTESKLMKLFGATRDELDRLRKVIEEVLAGKNRKIFFGILIDTLATSDTSDETVLKQTATAAESMDPASLQKLLRGSVSTATIRSTFGIADKGGCKQMQDALNKMRQSPLMNHPMAESLGLATGPVPPEVTTDLAEGAPGTGEEFKDGEVEGLPFDSKLPPLPYAGENMGFGGCEEGGGASEAAG